MIKLLKQIVARRTAAAGPQVGRLMLRQEEDTFSSQFTLSEEQLPIDEVKDIITLPRFDKNVVKRQADFKTVKLPDDVMDQIHNFIAEIALLYRYDRAPHCTFILCTTDREVTHPVTTFAPQR